MTLVKTDNWPPSDPPGARNTAERCHYIFSKAALGDGSYSTVCECKNTVTGQHYAAKMYSKRLVYGLEDMLQNEFHILKTVSMGHPNILTLIDHFETKDYLYLITDLALGGELFHRITGNANGKLPEPQVREITAKLVATVDYLHNNKVVHRDIKAENLLFQTKRTNSILVADFGLARILGPHEQLHDLSGTLSYMAPEMLTREGHDFAVDVWAIGVVVYFMLCGYMPFDCDSDDETRKMILQGDYVFEPVEYWDDISSDAKEFLASCFVVDPAKRPSTTQLLAHPFVSAPSSHNSHLSLSRLKSSTMSLPKLPQRLLRSISSTNLLSALSVKLTQLEKSRTMSLKDGVSMRGAFCESPDQVSRFTTPMTSATVSRETSLNDMAPHNSIALNMATSHSDGYQAKFFI